MARLISIDREISGMTNKWKRPAGLGLILSSIEVGDETDPYKSRFHGSITWLGNDLEIVWSGNQKKPLLRRA